MYTALIVWTPGVVSLRRAFASATPCARRDWNATEDLAVVLEEHPAGRVGNRFRFRLRGAEGDSDNGLQRFARRRVDGENVGRDDALTARDTGRLAVRLCDLAGLADETLKVVLNAVPLPGSSMLAVKTSPWPVVAMIGWMKCPRPLMALVVEGTDQLAGIGVHERAADQRG